MASVFTFPSLKYNNQRFFHPSFIVKSNLM